MIEQGDVRTTMVFYMKEMKDENEFTTRYSYNISNTSMTEL